MKKILNIVGARPQFIKAFVTLKSINKIKNLDNFLLHTGQHFNYEMSEIFFNELNFSKNLIKVNLDKKNSRMLRFSEMLSKVEKVVKKMSPNLIIVYGDTDSTLVGSLIAKRSNIKLMHIEAGLRSGVIEMPEEQNRIFSDYLSDYLICPNQEAYNNVKLFKNKKIFNYGDVMYDSFLFYKKIINKKYITNFKKKFNLPKNYIFFTIHRDANSNKKIIKKILKNISNSKFKFFWPIHPKLNLILKNEKNNFPKNIIISKPISYLESLAAIKESQFVITDSGGIQKEAYFSKKKCFVLRKETEWKDLLKVNAVKLIGSDMSKIEQNKTFLESKILNKNCFGNGKSVKKISNFIKLILNRSNEKK